MSGKDHVQTLLPLEARTATTASVPIARHGASGVVLVIDATVIAGGETITPSMQIWSPFSQSWTNYCTAAAVTATGVTYVLFGPAVMSQTTIGATAGKNVLIPAVFRFNFVHSGSGSHTYAVEVQRIDFA